MESYKNTSIELFDKRQNISYFYCLPNNFYTFAIIKSYLNAIQGRTQQIAQLPSHYLKNG